MIHHARLRTPSTNLTKAFLYKLKDTIHIRVDSVEHFIDLMLLKVALQFCDSLHELLSCDLAVIGTISHSKQIA